MKKLKERTEFSNILKKKLIICQSYHSGLILRWLRSKFLTKIYF